jgi:glutamate synthase (NADPH/NADH) small chain
VLGIDGDPVQIKNIENAIIDYAFEKGWVQPRRPPVATDKRIAVIGSGPAGLAVAEALNSAGHSCTVYEKSDKIGGLLYYGIPNMKLSKTVVDRRIDVLAKSGIAFRVNAEVGKNVQPKDLMQYHAIVLACGAARPRNLPIPGRELQGIHYAMDYLHQTTAELVTTSSTKANATAKKYVGHVTGGRADSINVKSKHVVVIGGGDTGGDCIATALRQGCKSVVNFELLEKKPEKRKSHNPWPQFPQVFKVDYGIISLFFACWLRWQC